MEDYSALLRSLEINNGTSDRPDRGIGQHGGKTMGNGTGCCAAGNLFTDLEPARQAEYLAMLAQEARLLEFSLESADTASTRIGDRLQKALEHAMDADGPDEERGARDELEEVLSGARDAGLRLSARLSEVDVDGILGTMKMRVLSTVLAPPTIAA
jgi:hypothetical protein